MGTKFFPVWTGSGLDRVFAFGEEQTTITCTIDTRVLIQGALSVGLQVIGECMQIIYIIKDGALFVSNGISPFKYQMNRIICVFDTELIILQQFYFLTKSF